MAFSHPTDHVSRSGSASPDRENLSYNAKVVSDYQLPFIIKLIHFPTGPHLSQRLQRLDNSFVEIARENACLISDNFLDTLEVEEETLRQLALSEATPKKVARKQQPIPSPLRGTAVDR